MSCYLENRLDLRQNFTKILHEFLDIFCVMEYSVME